MLVLLFVTPWNVACQAPLSTEFSRQEYWSGFPSPTPGDLLQPRMEPESAALAGGFFTTEPPGKPHAVISQGNLILPKGKEYFYVNKVLTNLLARDELICFLLPKHY